MTIWIDTLGTEHNDENCDCIVCDWRREQEISKNKFLIRVTPFETEHIIRKRKMRLQKLLQRCKGEGLD